MELTFNELFPSLNDSELQKELDLVAIEKSLDADEVLMETGKYIRFIPLVTEGRLKVYREDDDGHECSFITLILVKPVRYLWSVQKEIGNLK